MAKLFRLYFRSIDKEFSSTPERYYAKKVNKLKADDKLYLSADNSHTVLESEIKKYWDFGGGVAKVEFVGEMSDEYFTPSLSEAEFVDEQIKSKKNGEIVGYQG